MSFNKHTKTPELYLVWTTVDPLSSPSHSILFQWEDNYSVRHHNNSFKIHPINRHSSKESYTQWQRMCTIRIPLLTWVSEEVTNPVWNTEKREAEFRWKSRSESISGRLVEKEKRWLCVGTSEHLWGRWNPKLKTEIHTLAKMHKVISACQTCTRVQIVICNQCSIPLACVLVPLLFFFSPLIV